MAEALPDDSISDFSDEDQSPLDKTFNIASDHVKKITSKLDNNELLELYGLFKQSTEGSCNLPKPGWFDGRGRRKWEAWREHKDTSGEEAKQRYVELVKKYDPEFDVAETLSKIPKETWVAVSCLWRSPEPKLVPAELSLIEAAREDLGDLVEKMLLQNPDLKHEKDDDGLTAMHWAADRDATSALKAILEGGCSIDAVDDSGQTALHYAASCGHVKSTQILVDAGASLLKDKDDCTPLDLADDEEIRKILESAKSS